MDDALKAKFVKAAKRAVAGLDKSAVMIGILDERDSPERWEFALQIGHCLLHNKPLILIVPEGMVVPERLRLAASVVETYQMHRPESVQRATERALTALALEAVH